MKIFHYHPITGVLLGEGQADESPLEPGVWLIPAHATTEEPPVVADGEQAVWLDGWQAQAIPAPPAAVQPEPQPIPVPQTPEEKLAALGLTVDDLRALLVSEPPAGLLDVATMPLELERARNELGQFVADDPATPEVNEAWAEGTQP